MCIFKGQLWKSNFTSTTNFNFKKPPTLIDQPAYSSIAFSPHNPIILPNHLALVNSYNQHMPTQNQLSSNPKKLTWKKKKNQSRLKTYNLWISFHPFDEVSPFQRFNVVHLHPSSSIVLWLGVNKHLNRVVHAGPVFIAKQTFSRLEGDEIAFCLLKFSS